MMKYKYPDGTARWANSRREPRKKLLEDKRSPAVHELVLYSLARVKFKAKKRMYDNERNKKPLVKQQRAKSFKSWQDKNQSHLHEYNSRPERRKRRRKMRSRPESQKKDREYIMKRRQEDPILLMVMRLRSRFYCAVKRQNKGIPKYGRVLEMSGCTKEELLHHLLSNAEPGMDLRNTDIDHIFPIKLYDMSDAEDRGKIFHFSNLRLCWPSTNRMKSSSVPSSELASKVWKSKWPKSCM